MARAIAQRHSEVKERTAGGPAELVNTITFDPKDEPQSVWSSGDARVSAIRSTHIPGHASYRVDTPAGNVVIGGDAAKDGGFTGTIIVGTDLASLRLPAR
jgi:ribonuclease Z